MTERLFEAFFWIKPGRSSSSSPFHLAKVLWNYPDDVSQIIKSFGNIPKFCFPDLEKMKLERFENARSEHFTFTLKDADANILYGICCRALCNGEYGRYDVSRRPRHCLCFITRHPYFSLFKAMLLQIHSMALMDLNPARARLYIDLIYQQPATNFSNQSLKFSNSISITVDRLLLSGLSRNLSLVTPRYSGMRVSNREVSLLPLLELLGVDTFLLLLSAVMLERRIVFVADEVDRLSSSVLATASMLYPFHWHHMFIPLLPANLTDFAEAPFPYIIGVRRYLMPKLRMDALGDVLVVDADSGKCELFGNVEILDFIGESGSTLKQATEGLDRMKARAMNLMMQGKTFLQDSNSTISNNSFNISFNSNISNSSNNLSSTSASSNYSGPRDIVATVLSDLKVVLNNKPGATSSIQSVASGLLRTLPGGGKPIEELKVEWNVMSEKVLRDSLTIFFVYLFSSLDDFVHNELLKDVNTSKAKDERARNIGIAKTGEAFGQGDSRAAFDLNSFLLKRTEMGDSRALILFLSEFMHSQMFERFCDEKLKKLRAEAAQARDRGLSASGFASNNTGNNAAVAGCEDDEDVFESSSAEFRGRAVAATIAGVKTSVISRSSNTGGGGANGNGAGGATEKMGTDFHYLTLRLTGGFISNSNNSNNNSSSNPSSPLENNNYNTSNSSEKESSFAFGNNDSGNNSDSSKDSSFKMSSSNGGAGNGAGSYYSQVVERICIESYQNTLFLKIMKTLTMRLDSCKASAGRGSSGSAGVRSMQLLKTLLVSGPESVLSYALDLIPTIRAILQLGARNLQQQIAQSATQALEFMSLGAAVDTRSSAFLVLDLLLDHKKLSLQRRWDLLNRQGAFPYLNPKFNDHFELHRKDWLVNANANTNNTSSSKISYEIEKTFPSFSDLHMNLQPPSSAIPSSHRQFQANPLPKPILVDKNISSNNTYTNTASTNINSNNNLSVPLAPLVHPSQAPFVVNDLIHFDDKIESPDKKKPPQSGILNDIDEAKFFIVNRDNGEVLDLRILEKIASSPVSSSKSMSKPLSHVPILASPPGMALPPSRRNITHPSNSNSANTPTHSPHAKTTDPFSPTNSFMLNGDPFASSPAALSSVSAPATVPALTRNIEHASFAPSMHKPISINVPVTMSQNFSSQPVAMGFNHNDNSYSNNLPQQRHAPMSMPMGNPYPQSSSTHTQSHKPSFNHGHPPANPFATMSMPMHATPGSSGGTHVRPMGLGNTSTSPMNHNSMQSNMAFAQLQSQQNQNPGFVVREMSSTSGSANTNVNDHASHRRTGHNNPQDPFSSLLTDFKKK